jgi:hypothetical protein
MKTARPRAPLTLNTEEREQQRWTPELGRLYKV